MSKSNSAATGGRRFSLKHHRRSDLLVSALVAGGTALCAPLLPAALVTAPLLAAAAFCVSADRLRALREEQRPRTPQE